MKRLLCYAHFDEHGELKPFVKNAISTMRELCTDVIFVSNSPLARDDIEYLQDTCSDIIINDNRGYDFYMWKLALASIDYANFDEVVLLNSSVFGPFFSLTPVFDVMKNSYCDFWGITECFKIKPHIQSYFFVFKKNVITSSAFRLFWDAVLPSNNKNYVILSYEIGLTQWLIDAGFIPKAYLGYNEIATYCKNSRKKINNKSNYAYSHSIELLNIGNPFLKVDPVKKNKVHISPLYDLFYKYGYPISNFDLNSSIDAPICPICNNVGKLIYESVDDSLNLYISDEFSYYKCCNKLCGVLWQWPVPNTQTVKLMYNNYRFFCKQVESSQISIGKISLGRSFVLFVLSSVLKALGQRSRIKNSCYHELASVAPGKLLEIGCGSGDRLVKLKNNGWDVVGQDIDCNAYEKLKNNNINYIHEEIDKINDEQFDVILLSHVIEHIIDPVSFLVECRRLLKPSGKIYLSTPNNQSFAHFVFGKYWRGIDAPRHHFIYNNNSLAKIILASGYEIENIKTVTANTELFIVQSLDILKYRWTIADLSGHTVRKIKPLLLQLISVVIKMFSKTSGDECFLVATKMKSCVD